MWALADPELNGYVGSAGTVGEAWPHLQQVCRLERQRVREGQERCRCQAIVEPFPWALGHREPPPLGTGCDLRRGPLSGAHWGRSTGSGGPAEPGHQLGTLDWAFQRSRCPTPPQCPAQRSFRHDGLFLPGRRMKRPCLSGPGEAKRFIPSRPGRGPGCGALLPLQF